MVYRTIVFLHVASVILAIGPFVVLFPMLKQLRAVSQNELPIYLKPFRFVVQMSKHSGHVLVLTGVLLVVYGPWTWGTSWIVATLAIMVSSLFFLARAFTPTLKKMEVEESNRSFLVRKLSTTIWVYLLLMMTMLFLMVTKPTLW